MGLMQEFQKADEERRLEVKQLQGEVATMLKGFAKGDAERRSEVATMRNEMATMLKELAKQDTERRSEVASMLSEADAFIKDLAKGSAQRASEIAGMLRDFAKGDAERRSEVASIHKMVWGTAPAKKQAAPTVVKEAPIGELRDRVFAYLANHTNGTKLTELEEEFGVARIQMARVVRELMDSNKVEKREQFYFAI